MYKTFATVTESDPFQIVSWQAFKTILKQCFFFFGLTERGQRGRIVTDQVLN